MKFKATWIVVDADIAKSASLTEHPISGSSRQVLNALMASGLNIAFCPILLAEWKKHRSLFTARWLNTMIARKRFKILKGHEALALAAVLSAPISDKQQAIAAKDAHLVDIAIATDNFIASNDVKARDVFCWVANNHSPALHGVVWAVPAENAEAIATLFRDGGFVPVAWQIRTIS